VDPNILDSLKKFGFDKEYALKCIEANRHNHVTTTYNLLLKKLIESGGKSIADVTSDSYDPKLFQKENSKTIGD
jgi:5'-AMP-activated protein kinase catalytic alpha subunit